MNYKYIGISFTLKGTNWDRIAEKIATIAKGYADEQQKVILVHGFMPRDVVMYKGFDTKVIDLLNQKFPLTLNLYRDGAPLRDEMAELLSSKKGTVYVIGPIIEGVATEVAEYRMKGINIIEVPLAP